MIAADRVFIRAAIAAAAFAPVSGSSVSQAFEPVIEHYLLKLILRSANLRFRIEQTGFRKILRETSTSTSSACLPYRYMLCIVKCGIMKKEESFLSTVGNIGKQDNERTWEDIKRELELYWRSEPRYCKSNTEPLGQPEMSETQKSNTQEWLLGK